jgi:P27 family predicted phage terminase small subunit
MTRGRPRKPTEVKIAQGTNRPDRDMSIKMNEGIPDPPGYMSAQALIHWDRCVAACRKVRTLTEADGDALAMLCVSFEEWKAADIIVRDEGEICRVQHTSKKGVTSEGGAYQHPAVGIRTNAWKKIVKMLREFGLTPSARAGMKMAAHEKEENPIAEALKAMSKAAFSG